MSLQFKVYSAMLFAVKLCVFTGGAFWGGGKLFTVNFLG